jgi:hypothetical protein
MPKQRAAALRKAQNVSLARFSVVAFELHRVAGDGSVSVVAAFQDATGRCLTTVIDERVLMIDLAAVPVGTERIVLAVETDIGALSRVPGLRCAIRDAAGADLAALAGVAAGETSPDPVHLLGECYRRGGDWWFREVGYGLGDEGALTRALGPDVTAYHLRRVSALAARPAAPAEDSGGSGDSAGAEDPEDERSGRGLPPASLDAARIAGARRARGPVSLEVAVDLSGSMIGYARSRTAALRALAGFARREMAAGDLLTSVAFASSAAVLVPPVDVRALREVTDRPKGDVGGGTLLEPAIHLLNKLRRQRPAEPEACGLMVITDVGLGDDPRHLRPVLHQAGYQHIHLVVPESAGGMDHRHWFHHATVHHFETADQLGLIYGAVFAGLTGQRLESRK